MQRMHGVVQSKGGRVVVGALIQVFITGTSTPATIYADRAGSQEITQLESDNEGEWSFYAPNGRYDIKTVINGRVDGQLIDVLLHDPADVPVEDDISEELLAEITAIKEDIVTLEDGQSNLSAQVQEVDGKTKDFDNAHGVEQIKGNWADGRVASVAELADGTGAKMIGHGASTVGDELDAITASTGSGKVGYLGVGTSAVGRTAQDKLRDVVNIKDYGAKCDGITDDAAAIQAAILHIKTIGGGTVEFPSGARCKISSTINISGNFGAPGIEIRGNNATITATQNNIAFLVIPAGNSSNDAAPEYRQNCTIHHLNIVGPDKSNVASVGVQVQQGANVNVQDCHITNFYRGLHGYGALICSFSRLLIERCEYGIDLLATTPSGAAYDPQFSPNDLHFYNCQLIDNIKAFRALSFPAGAITLTGCEIEGNNLSGTTTDGVRVVEFFNAGKVSIIGCHMEENKGQYNLYYHGDNAHCHLNIIGSEITPGDSCGNCVYLSNASGAAAAANATIIGTRITNNVGSQLYISTGFKVTAIGSIFGGIQGDIEKLTVIKDGRIASGATDSPFAQMKSVGDAANGIAHDFKGMWRFVDASGNRLAYAGHNGTTTYMLADGTPLTLGTNAETRVVIGRIANVVEPHVDNTHSLGTSSYRWNQVVATNITLTPPASATPANNGEMTFQLTSNTSLAIKVKGSDGTVRTATLTLA